MNQSPGIMAALFDFSFTEYVTTRFVRILYVLLVILTGISCLMFLLAGLSSAAYADSPLLGFGALVFSGVAFFVYVVLARVLLEFLVVVHRIAEDTSRIVGQMSGGTASATEAKTAPPVSQGRPVAESDPSGAAALDGTTACPRCGATTDSASKFCQKCGASLAD